MYINRLERASLYSPDVHSKMGGSLTIHNTTKITVVVTLENTGINHCKDAILPGGKHDYDLARFNYDINVEGADDNTLQNSLGSEPRKARNVRIQGTDRSYHTVSPVRLPGISAKKSDGKTKEFYITGSEISRDELKLELSTAPPPPEPEIRGSGQPIANYNTQVVTINK